MVFRTGWKLICGTFNEWMDGDVSKFAASLAFYTLFSLVPTLMILLAIVGALYGEDTARTGIVDRFQWLIGSGDVQTIVTALDAARARSAAVTIVGLLGLGFGATAVFVNLQDALNSIWGVATKPGRVWPFFRKRLLSFVMILGLGLILLLSFLISTLIAALREFAAIIPISAEREIDLAALTRAVAELLPEGPALYEEDTLTDRDERFLAAEFIREKIFRQSGEEVPYSTAVMIESFEHEGDLRRIRATVLVDKASQRAILLGKEGTRMKAIASQARAEMEELFGGRVFLDVWVRVKSGWSNSDAMLTRLGY